MSPPSTLHICQPTTSRHLQTCPITHITQQQLLDMLQMTSTPILSSHTTQHQPHPTQLVSLTHPLLLSTCLPIDMECKGSGWGSDGWIRCGLGMFGVQWEYKGFVYRQSPLSHIQSVGPPSEPTETCALCHGFLMDRVCVEFFHLQKACVHHYHTSCHFYPPPPFFLTTTIALPLFFRVLTVE